MDMCAPFDLIEPTEPSQPASQADPHSPLTAGCGIVYRIKRYFRNIFKFIHHIPNWPWIFLEKIILYTPCKQAAPHPPGPA